MTKLENESQSIYLHIIKHNLLIFCSIINVTYLTGIYVAGTNVLDRTALLISGI